jgi:hypothetical protein
VCDAFWLLLQSKFDDVTDNRRFLPNVFLRNLIEFFASQNVNPQRTAPVPAVAPEVRGSGKGGDLLAAGVERHGAPLIIAD